jgi:hypothetical protein
MEVNTTKFRNLLQDEWLLFDICLRFWCNKWGLELFGGFNLYISRVYYFFGFYQPFNLVRGFLVSSGSSHIKSVLCY